MKKFKIYIASLLFVFASSLPANAIEMPTIDVDGLAMGVTVTAGAYRASGSETEGTTAGTAEKSSDEVVMGVGYPSIFVEYSIEQAMGLTLGIDYVPDTLSAETTSRKDFNTESLNDAGEGDDSAELGKSSWSVEDFRDLFP